ISSLDRSPSAASTATLIRWVAFFVDCPVRHLGWTPATLITERVPNRVRHHKPRSEMDDRINIVLAPTVYNCDRSKKRVTPKSTAKPYDDETNFTYSRVRILWLAEWSFTHIWRYSIPHSASPGSELTIFVRFPAGTWVRPFPWLRCGRSA